MLSSFIPTTISTTVLLVLLLHCGILFATPSLAALSPDLISKNQQRTFYLLFSHDIENKTSFPSTACGGLDCRDFESFIVQPENITPSHLQKLRREMKTRKNGENEKGNNSTITILAYFDTIHVPIQHGCATGHSMGDRPGRTCQDYGQCGIHGTYLSNLRAAFPPTFGVRNLTDGKNATVCTYPGLASYTWYPASMEAVVPVLKNLVMEMGFDGVYLDNRISPIIYQEEPVMKLFQKTSKNNLFHFDVNGDGKPDSYEDVLSQYTAYAPAFSWALRKALGPDQIIIGNSAGALSDPALNGITIEMEACLNLEECTTAIFGQKDVSVSPSFGVFWLTHSGAMPGKKQCERVAEMQKGMPWMRAGTDFLDGSHIVCN